MNLKNKTAIITGASDGIGKQVAIKLAEKGINLALIGRDTLRLNLVKNTIKKFNSSLKIEVYSCDIKNNSQLSKTTKRIISDFKNIHILINAAGIWQK